ncbi:MAG: molybdopterin molybdotransferase MoeA [Saprospiraceae bacterium]
MITVTEAYQLVLANKLRLKSTEVPLTEALGRVLDENIQADRPFPPFNRVTMDGIAISFNTFSTGTRDFPIEKVQAAGDEPYWLLNEGYCVEVMTGAILPEQTDVVIRVEDITISEGMAKVNIHQVERFQNIHLCGSDKPAGTVLLKKGVLLGPVELSVAASVGKSTLKVLQYPKTVIVSTGDELVPVSEIPASHQIRISNSYAIFSFLKKWGIPAEMIHLPDNEEHVQHKIKELLDQFELIILSGGVSAGKFDYIPKALKEAGIQSFFHKVSQRPGKPFFFGSNENTRVFALPGNPVSTLLCVVRYLIPWLKESLGLAHAIQPKVKLLKSIVFNAPLTFFVPVKLTANPETTILEAYPLPGNGSGDFANLLDADGFIELPENENEFQAGHFFTFWPFKLQN